jgi:glycosyltransferase involved in cell wall biosynthesis
MISLNEAHNMRAVLENIDGLAQEVFLVDSYSTDGTVDIALKSGVHVVQRRFRGFGDQWNFALEHLPVKAPWTMKLDPDERLSETLKTSIRTLIAAQSADGIVIRRRLWFMGRPLQVRQDVLRIWRTGSCRFSNVMVNEHPTVGGVIARTDGELEHHDSPNLHHWLEKQNAYSTAEALSAWQDEHLSAQPVLFGTAIERHMWLKHNFWRIPFRYAMMHLYCLFIRGAWRSGKVGFIWARLRGDVYRFCGYKRLEMNLMHSGYSAPLYVAGKPDSRVQQYD